MFKALKREDPLRSLMQETVSGTNNQLVRTRYLSSDCRVTYITTYIFIYVYGYIDTTFSVCIMLLISIYLQG